MVAVLLLGAALYSWVAAGTRTFTTSAEIVTTIPLVLLLAAAVAQARLDRPLLVRREGPEVVEGKRAGGREARFTLGLWIWGALISLFSLWELANLFAGLHLFGSRYDHPTVSEFLDSMTQHHWSKAVLFLVWLIFGVYLLRR